MQRGFVDSFLSSSISTFQPTHTRQDVAATVAALAQHVEDLASCLEGSSLTTTTVQHENPYSSPGLSVPDVLEANCESIPVLPDLPEINAPLDYSLFSENMSEHR